MQVLLVGAELEENLALRYLASALEARGHTCTFASFDRSADRNAVVEAVKRERPGVVGMSMTFQFRAREFGALAGALRAEGFRGHITVGGHFPTFAYREVLDAFPAIDTVVRHEGEETLPELCESLALGGGAERLSAIRGLAWREAGGRVVANDTRPLIADLDSLPFPKRFGEPQMHLGIPAAFIVGSRGCYGHCTFCCIHAYLRAAGGPKYRLRSADNVAAEMADLRHTRGARMFVFHDDDFFTRDHERDLARVTSLRDALEARGVRDVALVVKARPDDVDEQVFAVLEEIGLLRVYLGIEAGSTSGLRVLGRGVDLAENHRALRFLRDRGIYTCFNMLVFDPESTIGSLRESFGFLRQYPTVPMNFCRTEIYVGTPLMTMLEREGRLRGDVFGWDYSIREPAAERAFRVFASAFLDRNFRCDGLMNSTLGLGYHLHLAQTFYPGTVTRTLRELVDGVTRNVNFDCVSRMESILDFAATSASEDPAAFEDFVAKTTESTERANRVLEDDVASATEAIVRAALSPRVARRRHVPVWKALSAATLALAPMACDKIGPPPPPDPLPTPTLYVPPAEAGVAVLDAGTAVPTNTLPPPDPPPPPVIVDAGKSRPLPPPPPPPDPLPTPFRSGSRN
jgi:anaerobic magnesium-protoporphyrin IX monomethyl ester cyclase